METVPLGADRLVGERYLLEAPIGRGGMGEVWRAQHVALKTLVAIKFLHGSSADSERSRKRFLTEAQVTANLKTRYAVQVFDFGVTEDGIPYLVMELLEGETLDKRLCREGRLSVAATVALLTRAARALERAHALGIVHRDFKPENIMLVHDDEEGGELVKVVDFGIAKLVGGLDQTLMSALGSLARARGGARPAPVLHTLTNSGVGTPYYMAPEQVADSVEVGPAADLWAFGVVAYECLTGHRPFESDSVPGVLRRILASERPARASSRAPLPPAFDVWFERACAPDPAARFPDVQAAAAALAIALEVSASPASLLGPDTPMPFARRRDAVAPEPRAASPLAATLGPATAGAPPGGAPSAPPSLRERAGGAPPLRPERPMITTEDVRSAPSTSPSPGDTRASQGPPARVRPSSRPSAASGRRRGSAVLAAVLVAVAAIAIVARSRHDPSPSSPSVASTASRLAVGAPDDPTLDDPLVRGPVEPAIASSAAPVVQPIMASSQPSAVPPRRGPQGRLRARPSAYRLPPLGL